MPGVVQPALKGGVMEGGEVKWETLRVHAHEIAQSGGGPTVDQFNLLVFYPVFKHARRGFPVGAIWLVGHISCLGYTFFICNFKRC
jgi:hypothetical protein